VRQDEESHKKAQNPQKVAIVIKLPSLREGLGEGVLPWSSDHLIKANYLTKADKSFGVLIFNATPEIPHPTSP